MRNWTTKEILTLKRALRHGLSPEAIAQLLSRHSVQGIIAQARKERVGKPLPLQTELPRISLTRTPPSGQD